MKTRKITITLPQIIEALEKVRLGSTGADSPVTIEIPDDAPESFRVRTSAELHARWITNPKCGMGVNFGAQERTRDLAKLARWYLKNDWSMDRFQKFVDELDAIADKDGE